MDYELSWVRLGGQLLEIWHIWYRMVLIRKNPAAPRSTLEFTTLFLLQSWLDHFTSGNCCGWVLKSLCNMTCTQAHHTGVQEDPELLLDWNPMMQLGKAMFNVSEQVPQIPQGWHPRKSWFNQDDCWATPKPIPHPSEWRYGGESFPSEIGIMYGGSAQHGKLSLQSKWRGDDSVGILLSVLQDPWVCKEMGVYIVQFALT